MVTYYVTLFASLLINYLPHHHFCLCGIYVTTYVTPTMTSLGHLQPFGPPGRLNSASWGRAGASSAPGGELAPSHAPTRRPQDAVNSNLVVPALKTPQVRRSGIVWRYKKQSAAASAGSFTRRGFSQVLVESACASSAVSELLRCWAASARLRHCWAAM